MHAGAGTQLRRRYSATASRSTRASKVGMVWKALSSEAKAKTGPAQP